MNPRFLFAAALLAAASSASAQEGADPFAILEDPAALSTQSYFRMQAARTRESLERIPGRAPLAARIRELSDAEVTVTALRITAGTRLFYLKLAPGRQFPVLCLREGPMGAERVLVDPARGGAPIAGFAPSPDARFVAYAVARAPGEDASLRVFSVEASRDLPEAVERARFADEIAWHPDSRSFYYARSAEGAGARHPSVRLYRHQVGREASRDEIVFAPGVGGARDVPEGVHPSLIVPLESRYAYALAREGVRREAAVHVTEQRDLAAGHPRWRKLASAADDVVEIEAWKDEVYLLSHHKAPNYRVLLVKANAPDLASAKVVLPERDLAVQDIALAKDAIYLRSTLGGVDRLERVPLGLLGAKAPEFVKIPFDNAIAQLVTHPGRPGALLRLQGWIEAPSVIQVEARTGNIVKTRVQPAAAVDFSAMDEVRLYAAGHDGARIPITLVYRKNTTLTGENPTLLVGYGSHGVAFAPEFDAARLAWLERGGIFAVAHVRGGGEYGEAWHQSGMRAAKTNTILDLVSAAEFLVTYGFTSPKRLAVQGTGAGSLAAAGAMVRRPDLFAAVVVRAPWADMLRFESTPEGAANAPELGSSATREGQESLAAISAYQQVKEGAAYPAVLLTSAAGEARVDAYQPGKLAARLQHATSSGKPVLLRVDAEAPTRAQREEELADIYSFLLWQAGDPQFQPPAQ
jgi:prolyl oligopeptidase